MNHNYVRKCEEYLQKIPSQKLPPQQQQQKQQRDTAPGHRGMSPAAATGGTGNRNLSSRKLIQQPMPGVREKQPINNPGAVGVDLAPSQARGKNPGQQEKQGGSKFIRPCCRQQHQQQQPQQQQNRVVGRSTTPGGRYSFPGGGGPASASAAAASARSKASDNVNQLDNMKLAAVQPDGDYDGRAAAAVAAGLGPRSEVGDGFKLQQQNTKSGTESWDGILTASSFAMGTATSLSQIKSKNGSDHVSSPIIPAGPTSTPVVSSPSSSSLSTRPTSSIVAVAPQPRRPSAATPVPPPTNRREPMCKSSELETGINLFRFDPLRTLQFLTLELKSKLKALGGSTGSEHKQLYKISKELLLAVRILTESQNDGRKSTGKCTRCEKHPSEPTLNNPSTTIECVTCSKLQTELIQQSERHSHETEQLNEEINYLKARLLTQLDTKESKASTEQPPQPQPQPPPEVCYQAMVTDQLQQRLEGEIKRLQTMISDKQTLEDGLIADLNRKLQEATSRCRRLEHARNEAEKRLLYAALENERLNFLLSTQASTMTHLQSDFNVIENLAHQQIDLLEDRTQSPPPNGIRTSATRPSNNNNNNKASNPIITIIDNHHRNYRHSSGGNPSSSDSDDCNRSSSSNSNQQPFSSHHRRRDWQQQSPNADTTITTNTSTGTQEKPDAYGVAAEKLRKQKRHYSFKNIAEKESDDGNDANDLKSSHPPPPTPPPLPQPLESTMKAATKALDGGSSQGSTTEAAFRPKQDDHEMNVHWRAAACGSRNEEKTRTPFKPPPPLQSSLTESLSSVTSKRFGPTRRTILIDSDCEPSLPEQERPTDHGGNQTYAVIDPTAAEKRFSLADGPTADDDDDVDGIGSSMTNNDCARLRRHPRRRHRQETGMGQRQPDLGRQVLATGGIGRPSPSKGGKKDNYDDDDDVVVVEKYPRDYGDKFERRESCLLQSEKELCQNRPIIGQIRQANGTDDDDDDGVEAGNHPKKDVKVSVGRKTISAANEPASARTTEEFSIDFDDITLPSSPAPFRGGCLSSITGGFVSDDD